MSSRIRSIELRPGLVLLGIVTALAFAFGGCGDDDEDPVKPPNDPTPMIASTPENALARYVSAYEARDTMAVKAVYDSVYTGVSSDLNDPSNPISFDYFDEVLHVKALATRPGLRAYLDLGPSSTWTRMPSDDPSHPEWAVITIFGSAFRVEITDGIDTFGAIGEPGTFQDFAFSPELDSASPTDTLWKIVRWRETGNSSAPPVP